MADNEPFVWGSGGNKLTANERRRRLAEAMIKSGADYSPVQHWTQGAARVAQALLGGLQMRAADRADEAAVAALAKEPALQAPGSVAVAPAAPSMAGDGASRTMAMPNVTPEVKDGITQTASALGISPVDLATAISYETGGTFDPTKAGPRTQWGQHRGLIQFGEPQAREHGVDWNNPVASQLGPNGAVASYLKAAGVKPGMGMMDIYSAINAGGVGRYGASDANNGGAPGTVADKVNNQMAGHRAKALALFGDPNAPAPGAAPVAMESGQPGFFVPPGGQPDGAVPAMQSNGVFPNFDPVSGRWLGPGAPQQAPNPGDPMPGGPPPAMSGQTFNQVASALDAQPLQPVFQSEGIAQPWMGTAIPPQPPAGPRMVSAPLPPSRPIDLAMPQADLPAPGAVPTIGQFTPQPQEDLSNAPGAGAREGIVRALMAQQGQTPPVPAVTQVAAAEPARAPSPAVQQVAQAAATAGAAPVPAVASAAAQPSPGVDRVASAIRVMNSPYAQPGQKAVAQMILQQAYRDPTDTEMKRLQLEKAKRDAESAPLERESKQLDIDTKKKALGKVDAPTTKVVKQADGSEVALQWDGETGEWVPLKAPQGGNAVGSNPTNPYALPGKPTEGQAKDAGFAGRMVESHNQITSLESVGTDRKQAAAGAVPYIGNQLSSPDKQRFEQAKRNFVTAVLRKESGAAISAGEFETEEKKYFPQIGDSPEVIRQKRDARELAIEGVMAGAGNGYKVPDSYKPQRGKSAPPSGQTKSGVKWSVE